MNQTFEKKKKTDLSGPTIGTGHVQNNCLVHCGDCYEGNAIKITIHIQAEQMHARTHKDMQTYTDRRHTTSCAQVFPGQLIVLRR